MKDRVPAPGKANRVKITQDDGTVVEGVLSYADDATQEGSAYNKANVLPDTVCEALGLDTEASEPKDAFLAIPTMLGKALLIIKVLRTDGTPWPDCSLSGLDSVSEEFQKTGEDGQRVVYVDEGSYSISVKYASQYIDVTYNTESFTVSAGETKEITIQEAPNSNTTARITASRTIRLSGNVSEIDVFCVGGGGAGGGKSASNSNEQGRGGGGGGRTTTLLNVDFNQDTPYQAIIGAGGTGNQSTGGSGGTTSIFSVSAMGGTGGGIGKGGDGGSGGGSGGTVNEVVGTNGGSDGSNGELGDWESYQGLGQGTTTRAFSEPDGELFSGGGGGGPHRNAGGGPSGSGEGGEEGGGKGGYRTGSVVTQPVPGSANTGGGGGGAYGDNANMSGANGGSGIILLRWRNKT